MRAIPAPGAGAPSAACYIGRPEVLPVSLRSKLVSVLLFMGLLVAVPLGFHFQDLGEVEEALVRLRSGSDPALTARSVPPPAALSADEEAVRRLVAAAEGRLREMVGRAVRYAAKPSETERRRIEAAGSEFEALWSMLAGPSAAGTPPPRGVGEIVGIDPGDVSGWTRLREAVTRLEAAGAFESPAHLAEARTRLFAARQPGDRTKASEGLKAAALPLKRRLDEILKVGSGEGEAGRGAGDCGVDPIEDVRRTRIEDLETLEVMVRHDVSRAAFLLAVGALLALYFARILWLDVLDPLQRLRVSINNMAMSGRPTPVKTDGPAEVVDVLSAYNRMIDGMSGEGGSEPQKQQCLRCQRSCVRGDNYCRWCGFPIGTPSQVGPRPS